MSNPEPYRRGLDAQGRIDDNTNRIEGVELHAKQLSDSMIDARTALWGAIERIRNLYITLSVIIIVMVFVAFYMMETWDSEVKELILQNAIEIHALQNEKCDGG